MNMSSQPASRSVPLVPTLFRERKDTHTLRARPTAPDPVQETACARLEHHTRRNQKKESVGIFLRRRAQEIKGKIRLSRLQGSLVLSVIYSTVDRLSLSIDI